MGDSHRWNSKKREDQAPLILPAGGPGVGHSQHPWWDHTLSAGQNLREDAKSPQQVDLMNLWKGKGQPKSRFQRGVSSVPEVQGHGMFSRSSEERWASGENRQRPGPHPGFPVTSPKPQYPPLKIGENTCSCLWHCCDMKWEVHTNSLGCNEGSINSSFLVIINNKAASLRCKPWTHRGGIAGSLGDSGGVHDAAASRPCSSI